MPTISPDERDNATENFEGLGNNGSGGFYVDSQGNWNFGYGYNMTGNNDPNSPNYWETALSNSGVPATVISAAATAMASGGGAANANSLLFSSLTSDQVNNAEIGSMDTYFYNAVDPVLTTKLSQNGITFSDLSSGAQTALEDVGYNNVGVTSFVGPGLISALQTAQATGDYSGVAYQLAFNTAPANSTSAYAYRVTADALSALGLTYTINGPQNITAVSGSASADQIIEFLAQGESSTAIADGTPQAAMVGAINSYGTPLGFSVVDGIAQVTSGTYNTNNVNYYAYGSSTYGGNANTVTMVLPSDLSLTNTGLGVNTYNCSASGGPLSSVQISGQASLSCSASSSSSNIMISGTAIGTVTSGTATLSQSGDNFNMNSGTSVTVQPGQTETLTCGSTTQTITGDPNGSTASCSADGQLTQTISSGSLNQSGPTPGGVDGDSNQIGLGAGSQIAVDGSDNSISGSTNNNINITGNSNQIGSGTSGTANIQGSNNTFNFGGAGYLSIASGTGNIVNSDDFGDSVNLNSDTSATISGSGGYFGILGTGINVTASDQSAATLNDASYNLYGNGNSVDDASGVSSSLSGSNNTVAFNGSDYLGVLSGSTGNVVNADLSGDSVNLQSNTTTAINGSGGGYFGVLGTNIGVTASNQDSDTLSGASFTVTGSNDSFGLATDSSLDAIGGGNSINNSGDDVVVLSGTNGDFDTVYASGASIFLGDSSDVDIVGSNDTLYGGTGDDIDVSGQYDTISADGSTIDISGDGEGDYIDGSDDGGYGWGTGGYGGYGGYGYDTAAVASAQKTGAGIDQTALHDATVGPHSSTSQLAEIARDKAYNSLTASEAGTTTPTQVFEGAVWTSPTISWSFGSGGASLTSQEKTVVEQAFSAWGAASGLTFDEVSDGSQSDIQIGTGDFDTTNSGVTGYTSYQTNGAQFASGVSADVEDPNETALTAGADGQLTYAGTDATLYQVALHEIGHAIGLADNADPNSVMYYQSSSSNAGLDATDIAEVQALYGSLTGVGATDASASSALSASSANGNSSGVLFSNLANASEFSAATNQLIQALATFTASASETAAAQLPTNSNAPVEQSLAAHA